MSRTRADGLDALRGLAMVWMVGFHFCFDLNYFGFIHQKFSSDPLWLVQRTCIVTLFLFCAGFSQSLALEAAPTWRRFWPRWGQVVACALVVSLSSYLMFPKTFISFGVLHGMAVMLLITRASAPWRRWLWPLGALALLLPTWVTHPVFDARALNWVGLITHKPTTQDYVPVLPWLGLMWWGLASGQWVQQHRSAWLGVRLPPALQGLVWLGRRPLTIYMVHQPLLMGGLYLIP